MCAIFGWLKWQGRNLIKQEIAYAQKALATMEHRGPDFKGEWFNKNVYMGHQRLSVIDLSKEANQPFIDREGRYVLTFNGEIYNYIELKNRLEKENIRFKTASDTEVLLLSFIHWGKEAFLNFDGMFAVAIHDTISGKHYIFRDYLGQKPLYYYIYSDGIIYASELRALLALECFKWQVDLNSFLKFLGNSYYIWDTTPLLGVKKLLPGCYLEIDDARVTLQRYWSSFPGDKPLRISFEEAALEFQRLFDRSCEISMRADVPYGVFLSGGIDSSLILDSCYKINPEVAAFSVSMGERDFDERSKAELVSQKLSLKTRKSYLMDFKAIEESMDACLGQIDEPHGDPGLVNSYFLAKSCRKDIKVGIAGDGADELFGGYLPFFALNLEKFFKNIPEFVIFCIRETIKRIFPGSDAYLGLQFKALSFLQGFPAHNTTRLPLWLFSLSPEELQRLCPWQNPVFFSSLGEKGTLLEEFQTSLLEMEGKSRKQMLLYFYQKFFLPEFVCMHTDRAAMQSSLEVRSPFLSVSLIEFANRLPDNFKTNQNELKRVLRYVLRQRGYPEIIYKQKKHGFTFPVARWLKTALRGKMEELLFDKNWDCGLVDVSYLQFLIKQHLAGKRNNYRILYNLMVFRQWMDNFPQVRINI